MFRIIAPLLIPVAFAIVRPAQAASVQPPPAPDLASLCATWHVSTPVPANSVYGATATSNGNSAYVAGGYSLDQGAGDLNQFRRYDLASQSWTTLAPMSDAPSFASAVYSPINNIFLTYQQRQKAQ